MPLRSFSLHRVLATIVLVSCLAGIWGCGREKAFRSTTPDSDEAMPLEVEMDPGQATKHYRRAEQP